MVDLVKNGLLKISDMATKTRLFLLLIFVNIVIIHYNNLGLVFECIIESIRYIVHITTNGLELLQVSKRHPYSLLVGAQIITAYMKINLEVPQNFNNRNSM